MSTSVAAVILAAVIIAVGVVSAASGRAPESWRMTTQWVTAVADSSG